MLGISRGTLNTRIKEERQAQADYGDNISEAKRKKAKKTSTVLGHIRGEEQEHESMLKKLGREK